MPIDPTPVSESRPAVAREAESSSHAVKHAFRGSSFGVVRLEDLQEIDNLKADAVACYRPVNAQELAAVERIAIAQQQMFRGARLEAGLFTSALDELMDRSARPLVPMMPDMVGGGDIEITRDQNRNLGIGEGFRRIARQSNIFGLMLRYQAQAERMYRRAIEDFERLKKLRNEMPNHPGQLTQPDQPDEIIPTEELNPHLETSPETYAPRAASSEEGESPVHQPAPEADSPKVSSVAPAAPAPVIEFKPLPQPVSAPAKAPAESSAEFKDSSQPQRVEVVHVITLPAKSGSGRKKPAS